MHSYAFLQLGPHTPLYLKIGMLNFTLLRPMHHILHDNTPDLTGPLFAPPGHGHRPGNSVAAHCTAVTPRTGGLDDGRSFHTPLLPSHLGPSNTGRFKTSTNFLSLDTAFPEASHFACHGRHGGRLMRLELGTPAPLASAKQHAGDAVGKAVAGHPCAPRTVGTRPASLCCRCPNPLRDLLGGSRGEPSIRVSAYTKQHTHREKK